ncbi:MAG: hypothetical protein BZY75_05940 [SAR202 cluster bacterium Io17-Chloro-G7]|nr:MAG: hypothetical protein BZY75_05940 [SAR202 cluster bacterium Io17-Chloro-G7]
MPHAEISPGLGVLLDQNVPLAVAAWLRRRQSKWNVFHILELGLDGCTDREAFDWAQANRCVIITFDNDFADRRSFASLENYGIILLRVRPTTSEEAQGALRRLFDQTEEKDLQCCLVIVARSRIRIRPRTVQEFGS